MALLKRVKSLVTQKIKKIKSSLIYRLTKKEIEVRNLKKELEETNNKNLVKERKYIDELNIKQYEIRYIELQMARVRKYINSVRFNKDTNEFIREHIIELIKGNILE